MSETPVIEEPFTREEYHTALKVLEAARDDFFGENEIGNRRSVNQAHYTLQLVAERLEHSGVWDDEHDSFVTE